MSQSTALRHIDVSLVPLDNVRLQNLCGPMDENLRQIETAFEVSISRRGEHCRISGTLAKARLGEQALAHFYGLASKPLPIENVQLDLIELARRDSQSKRLDQSGVSLLTRKPGLHGRTPNQVNYLQQIQAHDISRTNERFSLSPGERVRVRADVAHKLKPGAKGKRRATTKLRLGNVRRRAKLKRIPDECHRRRFLL